MPSWVIARYPRFIFWLGKHWPWREPPLMPRWLYNEWWD